VADLDDRHGRVCSFDLDRLPVGSRIVHESGFHGMVRFLAVGRFVCFERFFVHRFPNVPQRHPSYDASGNLETGRCGSLQGLADVLLRTAPSPKAVSALCRPFHGFPAGRAGHALPSAGPSSLHDRRLRSDQAEAVPPREQQETHGKGEEYTSVEVHTLKHIADNPGITVTELARHNGKTKGAISQILKKIEKKGLVCREASNGDNKLPLFLTEKGKELDLAHRNYDMVHAGESMNEVRRLYTPEEMNTAFQVLETWLEVRRQVEEERKKNKIKQNYPVNRKD
jgi:DNA-binding MarR family transcriptional regulator